MTNINSQLDAYLIEIQASDHFESEDIIGFMKFLEAATHQEGSAVEGVLSAQLFNENSIGDLMDAGMIYYWHHDENSDYVIYTDKDRLLKFDMENLVQLHMMRALRAVPRTSWTPSQT